MCTLNVIIPAYLPTFTLTRVFFGQGSYGWSNIEFIFQGEKQGQFSAGRFNQYAEGVTVFLGGNHCYKRATSFPFDSIGLMFSNTSGTFLTSEVFGTDLCPYSKGPIVVGNKVWFGQGVTLFSGVTVGDGAVLGAQAVVRNDVPPYAIMVGNPAQIAGYRHNPEQVMKLLAIKWWLWDMEKISLNMPLLLDMDVNNFINVHYISN
jgi:chloramphenicol O-acetyltransferase type B